MALFDKWVDIARQPSGAQKSTWSITEKAAGRVKIEARFVEVMRSHYDDPKQIADAAEELGYPEAAKILRERLPRTKRARSGELGEIIATELVEETLQCRVPVRRLRYKDGREMALRGDDLVGILPEANGALQLLKGEAKSRAQLTPSVIAEAREALCKDDGRPSPASLLFVVDRLLERSGDDVTLGRRLRKEVAEKALPASAITHLLFCFSGNAAPPALALDLKAADAKHPHIVAHFRVVDHQAFIATLYEEAGKLGDA